MMLTPEQTAAYAEDGFLVLPNLVTPAEVAILRCEVTRLIPIDAPGTVREGSAGMPKSMFRMHASDGATASGPFQALSRTPRILATAMQCLGDRELYIHHTKVNVKAAIEGSVWPWHQDYGSWKLDGIQQPDMTTVMVMLDDASELNGCLYMLPGSHNWGRVEAVFDSSTAYRLWALPPEEMRRRMRQSPAPVAVLGRAGTAVIFHCNTMHASSHNLSPEDRWQAYFCYNTCVNRPVDVENPRPDYVRSRNWAPMTLVADDAVLQAGETLRPAAE
ncbi:MAG: phytanoyl-CoA dioxygenase [Alphaproteobacteria bacterium]|nr:phytanoyl-CoA dioxygenase [Alphaproteobacteria bacterium]